MILKSRIVTFLYSTAFFVKKIIEKIYIFFDKACKTELQFQMVMPNIREKGNDYKRLQI